MVNRISSILVFAYDFAFAYLIDFSVNAGVIFVCSSLVDVAVLVVSGNFNRRGAV